MPVGAPRWLLDTSTCVYALKKHPAVLDRLYAAPPDDVGITIITVAELLFGVRKSSTPEESRRRYEAFVAPYTALLFDQAAAESYAVVRRDLERRGNRIGERDLLIAAIAHSRHSVVVTHNVGEFARVPELQVEDWVVAERNS